MPTRRCLRRLLSRAFASRARPDRGRDLIERHRHEHHDSSTAATGRVPRGSMTRVIFAAPFAVDPARRPSSTRCRHWAYPDLPHRAAMVRESCSSTRPGPRAPGLMRACLLSSPRLFAVEIASCAPITARLALPRARTADELRALPTSVLATQAIMNLSAANRPFLHLQHRRRPLIFATRWAYRGLRLRRTRLHPVRARPNGDVFGALRLAPRIARPRHRAHTL